MDNPLSSRHLATSIIDNNTKIPPTNSTAHVKVDAASMDEPSANKKVALPRRFLILYAVFAIHALPEIVLDKVVGRRLRLMESL